MTESVYVIAVIPVIAKANVIVTSASNMERQWNKHMPVTSVEQLLVIIARNVSETLEQQNKALRSLKTSQIKSNHLMITISLWNMLIVTEDVNV